MDDLIAFLNARLDEDEAYARDPGRWNEYDPGDPGEPGRVLREVEAKRIILARYADTLARMEDDDYPAGVARDQAREYEDFVLPCLAAAWSGHPDYQQDWEP